MVIDQLRTNESYTTIAQSLMDACPSNVSKAWLVAEVQEDTSSAQYWYEFDGKTGQPAIGSVEAFDISDALIDIRAKMVSDGHEPWSNCTFSVFSDGRVKMDIHYPEPAVSA